MKLKIRAKTNVWSRKKFNVKRIEEQLAKFYKNIMCFYFLRYGQVSQQNVIVN